MKTNNNTDRRTFWGIKRNLIDAIKYFIKYFTRRHHHHRHRLPVPRECNKTKKNNGLKSENNNK